jgi:hypothetical protein
MKIYLNQKKNGLAPLFILFLEFTYFYLVFTHG